MRGDRLIKAGRFVKGQIVGFLKMCGRGSGALTAAVRAFVLERLAMSVEAVF